MKNFITELYFGNIDPQAKAFDHDSSYGEILRVAEKNKELLCDMLTGKEKKLFLEYINTWDEVSGITTAESFVNGFRIGAAFTLDAFFHSDNHLKDIE